jgi:RNA polymerase sigma factor (sigma-70 family)
MDRGRAQTPWTSLDTLLSAGTLGSLSDGQLLDRFGRDRDAGGQDAFRILVERHGAMVLGVCRSLVSDPHEAEDAFQATFLVLVRRAGSIRRRETLAPWLYGVARRVARRAQVRASRRRRREVAAELDIVSERGPIPESPGAEQALQEEIGRLPESLRTPLILCCLEGESYDFAARRLGVRESTLRGRLHRARRRLESRLKRRGLLAPLAARLADPRGLICPPLPSSLIESTTQFATRWSTVSGLLVGAGAVPDSIAALARGVTHAMLLKTVKVCGLATILTVGAVGTLVVAQQENAGTLQPPSYYPPPGARRRDMVTAEEVRRAIGEWEQATESIHARAISTKTAQIVKKLDDAIDLKLPKEVTLSQFLKAVKQATTDANFTGLPIYVEPFGVPEADEEFLNAKVFPARGPAPLRLILRQTLKQVRLSFTVQDDFVLVSLPDDINERRLEALEKKVDRLLEAMERLERASGKQPSERRKS